MEYTAGPSSWSGALRRAAGVLLPRRGSQRRRGWTLLVPVAAGCAGFLMSTAAATANGTELRNDRRPELTGLIAERRHEVATAESRAAELRRDVDGETRAEAASDGGVTEQRQRAAGQEQAAGLTALRGQGLTVRLEDAPRRPDGSRPVGATVDDLVVHQQDVQAVVNALWAGGADAVAIMGVRIVATSAVRCVGNTLLLDGRVYSPPFTISAIGDPGRLQRALDASEGVRAFRSAVTDFGLGYQIKVETDVSLPAYDGSVALRSARVPG